MPVRTATADDLPRIESLLAAAGLPRDGVAEGLAGFLVAEIDARVVAAAGLERHGEYGLLRSVVVDPACRGQGIAAGLCDALGPRAHAGGMRALYLLTLDAEGYFERLGFAALPRGDVPPEIRASDEFCSLCPDSAVVMRRTVQEAP
jgi:amino-acid N-acetyltransferase